MTKLESGNVAPTFSLPTPNGEVSLAELLSTSEKGVIVYFYPKAGTPGCTKEACDFRDNLQALVTAGFEVIGISPDSLSALERFASKQNLPFALGSDPDHQVMEEYGAWGKKQNYGRTYVGVIRSTFVINKDGSIELALYNVKATGHVARVMRDLGLA